jgi:signal transduction histidine kinase
VNQNPLQDRTPQALGISEPDRARRTLSGGILIFRWVGFTWMAALNIVHADTLRRPALAWTGIGLAGALTVWLTASRNESRAQERPLVLWIDLALSTWLILISGIVVKPLQVTGPRLFYATAYPLSTALSWGAAAALPGAGAATLVMSIALVLSRPINGISLIDLSKGQWLGLGNGFVNFLLAAGVAGVVARHLDRSAEQLRTATDEAIRARERAARLAERESLGRAIHDSILQALALIGKRGRELAERDSVSGSDVLDLAQTAGQQEQALRALIMRQPEEPPVGASSLRDALESVGRAITDLQVTVSAVGPLWLPGAHVEEVSAAVRQALENVAEHAEATKAAVFAESEDAWVIVSIRDDGRGFVYREEQLAAEGKAGLLKSMKGRIEDLGGRMRVMTAPGAGTEVEFRVPVPDGTGVR